MLYVNSVFKIYYLGSQEPVNCNLKKNQSWTLWNCRFAQEGCQPCKDPEWGLKHCNLRHFCVGLHWGARLQYAKNPYKKVWTSLCKETPVISDVKCASGKLNCLSFTSKSKYVPAKNLCYLKSAMKYGFWNSYVLAWVVIFSAALSL